MGKKTRGRKENKYEKEAVTSVRGEPGGRQGKDWGRR